MFIMSLQISTPSSIDSGKNAQFLSIFKGNTYSYLLLLNLISNCSYFYTSKTLLSLVLMACLSAALALIETMIFSCLTRVRMLSKLYLFLMGVLYTILIVGDYFCIIYFQTTFDQSKLDVLRETTSSEATEFLHTYLSVGLFLGVLIGCSILNLLLIQLSSILSRNKRIPFLFASTSFVGLVVWGFMMVSYIKFHNGFSIPQYTSLTRIAYSYKISRQRSFEIQQLYGICQNIDVSQTFKDKPNVIVLIGESASIYHSGLFGYSHNTTPSLKQLESKGELIAFDNAISASDLTHGVMESIFSLDSLRTKFNSTPLFPSVFKCGKYHTYCYDNQYFVGGINFLSDSILSKMMFSYRNTT